MKLHSAVAQKAIIIIIIVAAVRTRNLTFSQRVSYILPLERGR
jgi:hypothetical protein